jgi:hypothetical protein
MKITGYRGPYKHGFPTRFTMDDGTTWREATRQELFNAPPDLMVKFSLAEDSTPKPAGEYTSLRFPGNYPFLAGLAALRPVYIEDKQEITP